MRRRGFIAGLGVAAAGATAAGGTAQPVMLLCISDQINMHLAGVAGCKDMAAQQFFIFLISGFVRCAIQIRAGFNGATFLPGNIALNPYKQAIFYTSA
jgi:hypothetical protein